MIAGILQINLDPPYIGFSQISQVSQVSQVSQDSRNTDSRIDVWRHCSVDEIRQLMIDLDAILPHDPWPPRECVLRLPIAWSTAELTKLRLFNLRAVESLPQIDELPPFGRQID